MRDAQQSLQQFGVASCKDPLQKTRQAVTTLPDPETVEEYTTQTLDEDCLPDIAGYHWETMPTEYGPAEVLEWWRPSSRSSYATETGNEDPEDIPGTGGIVIQGADKYLRDHALTELDIPEYYSRFEDELGTTYRWSVDGTTHIDWRQVKRAVRVANGSGRIDPETTHVILCDTATLLVTGPRGCFFVELFHNTTESTLPDPPKKATFSTHGLTIAEEDPALQAALRRWLSLLENSEYDSPVSYRQLKYDNPEFGQRRVAHQFETETGTRIEITAGDLTVIDGNQETQEHVQGLHQFEHPSHGDETIYTAMVDTLPGEIGTVVTLNEDETGWGDGKPVRGIISGYHAEWKVLRTLKGLCGRRKPTDLEFRVRTGLIRPDGTTTTSTRVVAAFDLK